MKSHPIFAKRRYLKISMAITCMGRLCHLKETLIRNMEENRTYPNLEFVLLDYNSKDGLEDWVKKHCRRYIDKGVLQYYRTTEPEFFHMSHAKNMALLLSTGDIVVNLDADNLIGSGYAGVLNEAFTTNHKIFCRCSRNGDNGSGGRIAMWRKDLVALGGYEEEMIGWGYEDADLVVRARRINLDNVPSDKFFCRAIQHDDALREAHHTPPGSKHIYKSESTTHNHRILEQHRRHRRQEANKGVIWGRGRVTKNFKEVILVGSVMRSPSDLYVPDAPNVEAVTRGVGAATGEQPLKNENAPVRTAGHFVISRRTPRQMNEKV